MSWCLVVQTCACGATGSADANSPAESAAGLPEACKAEAGEEPALTIDDFEDGDLLLDARTTLHGVWYLNNDGTGTQSPAPASDLSAAALLESPGSPESPAHALHTSGSGFSAWGAFTAVRLNSARAHACTFDLSRYTGIELSVKGTGGLRLNTGTVATTPVVDGGECHSDRCSDFGQHLELSSEWSHVSVAFEDLSQPDWAEKSAWQPERALRLSFWAEGADFDLWLDDLRFYR